MGVREDGGFVGIFEHGSAVLDSGFGGDGGVETTDDLVGDFICDWSGS